MNSRLELLIFTPTLAGGVGRVLVNLADQLSLQGISLEIATLQTGEAAFLPHVPVNYLPASRTLKAFPALIRLLRQKQPKTLLTAVYHANLVGIWAGFFSRKIRVVISEHTALSAALQEENFAMRNLLRILIRLFYPLADKVVSVSKAGAVILKTFGVSGKKISVIYNPVITTDFYQKASVPITHPWLNAKTLPVIVSAGRLDALKDLPTLLRAFAGLEKLIPSRLLILGEGPDYSALVALAKELQIDQSIDFLGFVENPYPFIRQADVFVLSSRFEGLPTVLIEALALKVKIVSTDCPTGPNEILLAGKLGRLVSVGDADKLCAAIAESLQTKSHSFDLEEVIKPYTLSVSASLYRRVLFDYDPS